MTATEIQVRYAETDQMGHAYYANYLVWLEVARTQWCRDHGFTYLSLEQSGFFLPVVEANVRYRHEIRYDDLIVIEARMTEMKRSSMKFEYRLLRGETLCAEGFTWHVLMGSNRKAVTIPDDLRTKMQVETPESS
ncbi:MAG: acyl-CoA thioesterase [Armatimonadetes bacterium]|nr:acyl-CoA thioesterase [Armatimonadota bacterium]